MDINRNNAMNLWDERYGKQVQEVNDFSGRKITKGQYGDTDSKTGWTIDHRLPVSKGGHNVKGNLEIVHHLTNAEKGDKITFTANGKQYQVKRDVSHQGFYQIVELISDDMIENSRSESRRAFAEDLFNDMIVNDLDFTGRTVDFDEFETDSPNAWGLGFFVNKNQFTSENCFVAHKDTLFDQDGKTNFKTNNKVFELRKIEDHYIYINVSELTDEGNYYNVLGFSKYLFLQERTLYRDVVTIRVCAKNLAEFGKFLVLLEELLARNSLRSSYLLSQHFYSNGFYYKRDIHIIFNTPNANDTTTVHEFVMYLNTLRKYLFDTTNLTEITIYHSTHEMNVSEYQNFLNNIENYLSKQVSSFCTNTIYLTEGVKNFLTKSNYRNDSFESKAFLFEKYYERNVKLKEFSEVIKKY